GATTTYNVETASTAGTAQQLTLSASAPAGVTASISPTTVTAGGNATLTVTAANPAPPGGLQVVVRADATSGSVVQTHTAALLLSGPLAMGDLGAPPEDLAQAESDLAEAAADLAQPPGNAGQGSDDAGAPGGIGSGGGGTQP